jgi:hypothetical protein
VASVVREVKAAPVDRAARAVAPAVLADLMAAPAALVALKDAVVKVVLVDRADLADAVVERWMPSSTRS